MVHVHVVVINKHAHGSTRARAPETTRAQPVACRLYTDSSTAAPPCAPHQQAASTTNSQCSIEWPIGHWGWIRVE
jgi:hypothetical protein